MREGSVLRHRQGFTLIVVAIIGIWVAIILPVSQDGISKSDSISAESQKQSASNPKDPDF